MGFLFVWLLLCWNMLMLNSKGVSQTSDHHQLSIFTAGMVIWIYAEGFSWLNQRHTQHDLQIHIHKRPCSWTMLLHKFKQNCCNGVWHKHGCKKIVEAGGKVLDGACQCCKAQIRLSATSRWTEHILAMSRKTFTEAWPHWSYWTSYPTSILTFTLFHCPFQQL